MGDGYSREFRFVFNKLSELVEAPRVVAANGWAYDTILENYPQLKRDDILAALRYASEVLKEERVFPLA